MNTFEHITGVNVRLSVAKVTLKIKKRKYHKVNDKKSRFESYCKTENDCKLETVCVVNRQLQ